MRWTWEWRTRVSAEKQSDGADLGRGDRARSEYKRMGNGVDPSMEDRNRSENKRMGQIQEWRTWLDLENRIISDLGEQRTGMRRIWEWRRTGIVLRTRQEKIQEERTGLDLRTRQEWKRGGESDLGTEAHNRSGKGGQETIGEQRTEIGGGSINGGPGWIGEPKGT